MNTIYKKKSKEGIELVINQFKKNLENTNFGILWELDLKDKINSKGIEFKDDYMIFEICNPKIAKEVLNINKDIGVFLPCKIIIYRENDETIIAMPEPKLLVELVDNSASEIAANLEGQLKKVIDLSVTK